MKGKTLANALYLFLGRVFSKRLSRRIAVVFVLCSLFFISFPLLAQQNVTKTFDKIVIDAGHGGIKPGAIGSKYKEKDITLSVAIKLGKIINENLKTVKVYYTRVIDQDVDLYKRSSIANRMNADLFISIHCNSSVSSSAGGTETYAMGLGKTERNLEVAKKENAEMLTEAGVVENYQGFDVNSPESDILMSLYQNAYLQSSLDFAAKVQREYNKYLPMKSRGVHQANFVVLWKAAMPAVLTEIGFISNTKEEAFIGSEYGQWLVASCIFRAIFDYRNKVEHLNVPIPEPNELIPKDVLQREYIRKENERMEKERIEKERLVQEKKKQDSAMAEISNSTDTISNNAKSIVNPDNKLPNYDSKVVYRVQVLSSPMRLQQTDARFQGFDDVYEYKENHVWKYTFGNFSSQKDALAYQKEIRQKYKDAFVVAFDGDRRISIAQAARLTKISRTKP